MLWVVKETGVGFFPSPCVAGICLSVCARSPPSPTRAAPVRQFSPQPPRGLCDAPTGKSRCVCGHNARGLLQSVCRSSVRTCPGSFCRWGFPVGPAHAVTPKRCRPAGGYRWVSVAAVPCCSQPLGFSVASRNFVCPLNLSFSIATSYCNAANASALMLLNVLIYCQEIFVKKLPFRWV